MCNNKFVDRIISDKPEKEFEVMLPESKLDEFIDNDAELKKLSYRTLFHKSFHENIDATFPYKNLSLQQIGIPPFDVLKVSTEKGLYYVELSGDAQLFL
jgi:adenylyltransferase/sulfurtransferase